MTVVVQSEETVCSHRHQDTTRWFVRT